MHLASCTFAAATKIARDDLIRAPCSFLYSIDFSVGTDPPARLLALVKLSYISSLFLSFCLFLARLNIVTRRSFSLVLTSSLVLSLSHLRRSFSSSSRPTCYNFSRNQTGALALSQDRSLYYSFRLLPTFCFVLHFIIILFCCCCMHSLVFHWKPSLK